MGGGGGAVVGAISQARSFPFHSADHLQNPADTKRFLSGTGQMLHPVGGAILSHV